MRITVAIVLSLTFPALARAQDEVVSPSLEWKTVETKHFVVHYPATAEPWTLDMASRLDGAYVAVSALVGNALTERVTVIVEDPNNAANGFALPFLNAPLVFFWPTPADPYGGLGGAVGWGELLSVHEFAHIAHLTRPSRNPNDARLARWSTELGPVAVNAPRWAIEGYATYVEGKITGAGRPHSAARAAVLREWALAGALPTYDQLDGDPRYLGGNMAYLVGSAYLEWLVARPGQNDSSLPHLWRRMSARRERSFSDAFAGVFGAPPNELYGRFSAEITARAVALEHALTLDSSQLGAGAPRTVQRLMWNTGGPALSPNDSLLALTRSSPIQAPVVEIWPSHARRDTLAAQRRAKMAKLDPLDVPGVAWQPAPLPVEKARYPQGGASFAAPRWMPDGTHLLLTRNTGPGNGQTRRELFLWAPLAGSVRRVTHAGGILGADAMPDGESAIADRCVDGICSLVRVDLATGGLTPVIAGAPRVVYQRPRVSPDGRTIAASRHASDGWRVVLIDIKSGAVRVAGPDDGADRYDGAWRADGRHLVVVSEAGGVPNLEEIDAATGATRALTRVASAVRAPEPRADDGGVYFLRLHARGLDLDRVAADSVPPLPPVSALAISPAFAPVALDPPVRADTFPVTALSPRPYGLGPRNWRVLPAGVYAAEGSSVGLMASTMDPVGKLTMMAQGLLGTPGSWQGGALGAAWRGWPVELRSELFYSENAPSRQWGFAAPASLDATMAGGVVAARLARDLVTTEHAVTLGLSIASFRGDSAASSTRSLGYLEYRGLFVQSVHTTRTSAELAVKGAAGSTAGAHWTRGLAALTLTARNERGGLEVSGSYGRLDNAAAQFEQFSLGGTAPPFFETALYAPRIEMPALPAGVGVGKQVATFAAALPFMGLRPYYWSGSTTAHLDYWERVVGLESEYSTDGIWFARLPGLRVLGGVGYAYSGSWRYKTRFYFAATFRP